MKSIVIDTMKISINPRYVNVGMHDSFRNLFSADCQKPDGRAGKKIRKDLLPYGVDKIEYYEEKADKSPIFEMKLSSKILGSKYTLGISEKTIHHVCTAINKIDGFEIYLNGLLHSQVHEVHTMVNCLSDNPIDIMNTLNGIRGMNQKFKTDSIGGTSILFHAKAMYRKEKLNIYYKYPELLKDKQLQKLLDKEGFKWAERNIRVELRVASHSFIRKRFGSIILEDILHYSGNPVLDVFNEIYKGIDFEEIDFKPRKTSELEALAFIQLHNWNISSIRRAIFSTVDKTNLSKKVNTYVELMNRIESQKLNDTGNSKYFKELQRKISEF